MVRTGPSNPNTRALINSLKKTSTKHDVGIWSRVAELVSRPARKRPIVNIGKINRHTEEGDTVVIPGKVLGSGVLRHKVTIAALNTSKSAVSLILGAGASLITIQELLEKNPNGSDIIVLT